MKQNVSFHAIVDIMPGRDYETLFDLAGDQYGYVTAEQARLARIEPHVLPMMAKRGRVTRVSHGLYRFASFPAGPLDGYMEAVLWPRGARGVLSYETALDIYDLSDVNPARVHITLPPKHRIWRAIPKLYELHFESLGDGDITYREGLPITTVERTIRDCHRAHLRHDLLEQAVGQARTRGMLNKNQESMLIGEIRYAHV